MTPWNKRYATTAEANRAYYQAHRERRLAQNRAWNHQRRASGRCITCGVPKAGADLAFWNCAPCRRDQREYARKRAKALTEAA